ncbi:MAG TPA: cytochrome c3 family protein [bacterium]|nr:cytochrome c3 family protein [bacterium]
MNRVYRLGFLIVIILTWIHPGYTQTDDDCLMCHGDATMMESMGVDDWKPLVVNQEGYNQSIHSMESGCVGCHWDISEFPHPEKAERVDCGTCHYEANKDYLGGIHGKAYQRGAPYAPTCKDCHGDHEILPPTDEQSLTYKMNIPYLCGKCHQEGAPVANVYNIHEHNILENYSQSIHGEGLFQKGLTVTATCNNCHGNHKILPHTNLESTVSITNVAGTCMQCHTKIEDVHVQVIRGELWEEEPGAIPACTDCHRPHRARKEAIVIRTSDRECLECHSAPDIHKVVDGKQVSMTVTSEVLDESVHETIACVKCHTDVDPQRERPCETAGRVDCSNCHAQVAENYFQSSHGQSYLHKNEDVPYCTDCHGDHATLSPENEESPSFRANIPQLCGECHGEEGPASQAADVEAQNVTVNYATSVHGVGLREKGLLPSAICIDCHNSHLILDRHEERSSIYEENIPATCGTCHRGIFNEYTSSIHNPQVSEVNQELPNCADCHSSHTIREHGQSEFLTEVTHQCGSCHEDLADTYFDTMHGKAYTLGNINAAKCSDCHGAHGIQNVNNPDSRVGFRNIVETCQQCHPDANRRFTGYLTHATHHDPDKYPALYVTFWTMSVLLIGVFSFFGMHTLLWLPKSFKTVKEKQREESPHKKYYIRRFTSEQRIMHLFVIVSFMALALTGMMLKFANMPWAQFLADLLGGPQVAGGIHRFAAVITFGYFFTHLYFLIKGKIERKVSSKEFFFGKNNLMFNKQDLKDFKDTMKWFFGRGPRPDYGRWTYWEKFDYFAVFWGVAVIGFSGLMLWFPEFFTKFFPGWLINVATIVHSDEALLAVGFIFTIHFFNTHLRPEAFPMDTVIFTGLVPLDEFRKDRPREYAELKESGKLKKRVVTVEMSSRWLRAVKIFGYLFLSLGISLIILIIYSMLFGYQ